MAGELFTFGLRGSGAFNNSAFWTPEVGAPPRPDQKQLISVVGETLNATAQPWTDYTVEVSGANNPTIVFGGGQTLGQDSSLTQKAPSATYRIDAGALSNFGDINIGGAGQQATARIAILPGSSFVNNGPINVDGSLLVTGGPFVNNSTISIQHGTAQFQSVSPGAGAASVIIGEDATLAFTGFFANTTVSFAPEENGRLLIGAPFAANTLGDVNGFDKGDILVIPGQGTNVQWQQAPADQGAPRGTLVVGNSTGGTLAAIDFTGTYEPGSFTATPDPATGLTTIETSKVGVPIGGDGDDGGTSQTSQPVLDLETHGFRDIKSKVVNGPNDVTLEVTNFKVRANALQSADFLDGSLVFDGSSPDGRFTPDLEAAQIARMYYTVLGRAPEFKGAHDWVETIMEPQNRSIQDLAPGFYNSEEFKIRYGEGTSDVEFVRLLYRNVLGREGEQAGVDGWTQKLAAGGSRAEVVASISESAEHKLIRAEDVGENGIKFYDQAFL